MKSKFILTLLIGLLILTSTSEAAKIDVYRNALINKSFTIKYKITTPPAHRISKEMLFFKRNIFDRSNVVDLESTNTQKHINGGIIVMDGTNKYIETDFDPYIKITEDMGTYESKRFGETGECTLFKDEDVFHFFWRINSEDKKQYFSKRNTFGSYSQSIKANDNKQNPYDAMINEYNYGNAELAQALTAILPPDKIIATPYTPIYKLIGSGTLNGGLTYEDFAGTKNNVFYAVRYYFSGDKLVKIATFNYLKEANIIKSYSKSVIDITEFATTPDKTYLELPEGMKDKTKRDKEVAK